MIFSIKYLIPKYYCHSIRFIQKEYELVLFKQLVYGFNLKRLSFFFEEKSKYF